jgi:hypothetical protein
MAHWFSNCESFGTMAQKQRATMTWPVLGQAVRVLFGNKINR